MSEPIDATHFLPYTGHTEKTWIKVENGWCYFWSGEKWIDHGRPDAPLGCVRINTRSKGDE